MNKKTKIEAATISLTAIIVLCLFALPASSADISHEFYGPLGPEDSWSFEAVGSSVFQPPPGWTATGGMQMQFPRTDLNGDNKIDDNDLNIFLSAYGDSPGYDFDGSGTCDYVDLAVMSKTLGTNKSHGVLYGDYSWLMGGYGESTLERSVETHCIQAIEESLEDQWSILVGGFAFGFWFRGKLAFSENCSVRAEAIIHYTNGSEETIRGPWCPVYADWAMSHVEVCGQRTGIDGVKVRIRTRDAEIFVDAAKFTLEKSKRIFWYFDYCQSSIGLSVLSYMRTGGLMDSEVRCIPSVYIEQDDGIGEMWFVKWVQLTAKIIDHGDTSELHAWTSTQQNDLGYIINPTTPGGDRETIIFVATVVISLAAGVLMIYAMPIILTAAGVTMGSVTSVILRAGASTVVGLASKYILEHIYAAPSQPTGKEVWVRIDYPTSFRTDPNQPPEDFFVESTNVNLDLSWAFNSASSSTFEVEVKATWCMAVPFKYWSALEQCWYWILGSPIGDERQFTETMSFTITA